ncbi:EamA family transporter [Algoriphagus zhangzhouensis]|uniref:Threonine/homoserine efflux transporter RhtA n=1 Tax=Algoriphagus zhangzhouensis TaxID=1073327 RepID=A0A1M7ZC12_9BACT|nr:EamA family transporter [Algoriphagus zhangzhouensis]TDY45491.1 threonine/homoserine efflux transporter RhtA [Algoriphagus zhangzhouensis]SHO62451.1 Threonine/homoserine efflux transporter RhtA [Algoriphagus zhangzhouensis]
MIKSSQTTQGLILALSAAIFWGISGNCAQYLFEYKAIDPSWLVCWRLMLAGLLLVSYELFKKGKQTFEIWKTKSSLIQLLVFSIFGMLAVQYSYFYSIKLSNAATATVLQYIGPVFVVSFYAIKFRRWPVLVEFASMFFAVAGTFLLVTHGNWNELVISEGAFFWGIISAITLAFYTIYPVQLLKKYSAASITGWAMLIGGLILSVFLQPWQIDGIWDASTIAVFAYIILFGSLIPFMFFLSAVPKIGAQTASLLCSVEPLAAAIMAVLWLGVSFSLMDWMGTALILSTIVLLTFATKPKEIHL